MHSPRSVKEGVKEMCMFCGGMGAGPQGGLLAFGTMDKFRVALCGLEKRHRTVLRKGQLKAAKGENPEPQAEQPTKGSA